MPSHKKQSRRAAEKVYAVTLRELAKRESDPAAFLLDRATAYYSSPLGQTVYCNGPAPFLNQGHYDDDPAAWQRSGDRQNNDPGDGMSKALAELDKEFAHDVG